jgi:hypothetical protein
MILFDQYPPTLVVHTGGAVGAVTLSFTAVDTVYKSLYAVVNWGDGSSTELSSQTGSLVCDSNHSYGGFGKFIIQVSVRNRALPTPQIIDWSGEADFTSSGFAAVENPLLNPAVIGPVLPSSRGASLANGWSFNLGTDDACIISSLYLLLTTAKGERLMLPGYGTNLRRLVFSLADSSLDLSLIHI